MPQSVTLKQRVVELINSVGTLIHFSSVIFSTIEQLFSKVRSCMNENERAILEADNDTLEDFNLAAFSQRRLSMGLFGHVIKLVFHCSHMCFGQLA